jgi:hypothetical protein
MNQADATERAADIMLVFARLTGLAPAGPHPQRYLWTDAFAVCTYLELFRQTGNTTYQELALRLVDQVHHTLGRHRDDDTRCGWISGLPEREGELHPTLGGLRIGKPYKERGPDEPFNERREWDQDGQYYHYLTKWMHALNQVSRATGDVKYLTWAIELAQTVHAGFTYNPGPGSRKRMYWKMSIDLTRPLVPSMGQHDPLDGFVTYNELQLTAVNNFSLPLNTGLDADSADMADICRGINLFTDDPLGIGGLLSDASRIAQLTIQRGSAFGNLLEFILDAAWEGLDCYSQGSPLGLPAGYRLAFRELGLSIGLSGTEMLAAWIDENPDLFGRPEVLQRLVESLSLYGPLGKNIEQFWMQDVNRQAATWTGHREINMVMLATSLSPRGFLVI